MGILDTLFGRTKPVPPKLDDLFALPGAAIQLEAAAGVQADRLGLGQLPRPGGQAVRRHPEGGT